MIVLWREEEADSAPIQCSVVKAKWGGIGANWSMQRNPDKGGRLEVIR
jgi:hypothetical protein